MYAKKRIFIKEDEQQYINWKAVLFLKHFVSRFGNIKPSKYTGVAIKVQKKIKIAITKARLIGVVPFIK